MFIVLPMSFTARQSFQFPPPAWSTRWYENFFADSAWYQSLLTSLEIALLTTVLATALGTAAAFALDRGHVPAANLVRAVLLAPMIVPVVVLAIGLYAVFLEWHLTGTTLGFVLAHTMLAIPFVFVTVAASLRTFDRQLERAAAGLGASPFSVFRRVTLPLILPGVLAGALFAFNTSFDELVIGIFLVSPSTRTLPVQMYSSVLREVDPTIAAASTMLIAVTLSLLVFFALTQRWRGRYEG